MATFVQSYNLSQIKKFHSKNLFSSSYALFIRLNGLNTKPMSKSINSDELLHDESPLHSTCYYKQPSDFNCKRKGGTLPILITLDPRKGRSVRTN